MSKKRKPHARIRAFDAEPEQESYPDDGPDYTQQARYAKRIKTLAKRDLPVDPDADVQVRRQ
jgi:hypothetical protein